MSKYTPTLFGKNIWMRNFLIEDWFHVFGPLRDYLKKFENIISLLFYLC